MTFQSKLKSQRNKILALLIQAKGGEVSVSEILRLGVARYGARIGELKKLGFTIRNRQEVRDGETHSFYKLLPGPTPPTAPIAPARQESLFDLRPEARYPD